MKNRLMLPLLDLPKSRLGDALVHRLLCYCILTYTKVCAQSSFQNQSQ